MTRPPIVVLVPAGRRCVLDLCLRHILAQRHLVEEVQLWMNASHDPEDADYIRDMVDAHKEEFKLVDDGAWKPNQGFQHYGRYYDTLTKDDTIYIKIDDDVVWMSPKSILQLAELAIENPYALITVPNIVNNAAWNLRHQAQGFYPRDLKLEDSPHDHFGHHSGMFAEMAHRSFLWLRDKSSMSTQDLVARPLGKHTPNHVFAFRGRDLQWSLDDEKYITVDLTLALKRPTLMAGGPLFSHFAYSPQWPHMLNTDVLMEYRRALP